MAHQALQYFVMFAAGPASFVPVANHAAVSTEGVTAAGAKMLGPMCP